MPPGKIFKLFKDLYFEILVENNRKIFQYLDIEFNLSAGTVSSHRTANTVYLQCVNSKYSQRTREIKHNPVVIDSRFSRNFQTKEIFYQRRMSIWHYWSRRGIKSTVHLNPGLIDNWGKYNKEKNRNLVHSLNLQAKNKNKKIFGLIRNYFPKPFEFSRNFKSNTVNLN